MRYLLDTNVLSEPARPAPDPRVVEWLRDRSPLDLAISVLVLGEVANGVALMPPGHRKEVLTEWLEWDLRPRFQGRVLAVDEAVALAWAAWPLREGASAESCPWWTGSCWPPRRQIT